MNNITLPAKAFYFIRHGETDYNKDRLIMGQIDIPLNNTGIMQAKTAADIIGKLEIEIIYASPLERAHQTAKLVNQKDYDIILEPDLMERCLGEFEGKPHDPKVSLTTMKNADLPNGAETFDEFTERVFTIVNKILIQSAHPLLVSHGGVFVALAVSLGFSHLRASNCAIFRFDPSENGKWNITELTANSFELL